MTSLLLLAQDLFERANNPAYGVTVNDEHAARLAAAIGPEDVERFASEVARLDDPNTLTSYGWAWVLEFAVGHDVVLDRTLLAALCFRWDEPALKALVIESALRVDGADSPTSGDTEWLDSLIERAAPLALDTADTAIDIQLGRENIDEPRQRDAVDIGSAEALLISLLIVGTAQALAAARRLLERSWPGAAEIAEFLASRLNDSDPLSRAPWEELRG